MNDMALRKTPLHRLHIDSGARMMPFAGFDMPLQYRGGIRKEHLHTREAASLFDVSHMGQLTLRPRSGDLRDVARALETVTPVDVLDLPAGRQRYALLTNINGGIIDDLMIANCGGHFTIVVNASRKEADAAHFTAAIADACILENRSDLALLAVQGPAAGDVVASLMPDVRTMMFMDVHAASHGSIHCMIARSGYTGEDGFEISVPAERAEELALLLLRHPALAWAGLGARDSLRLEAGLCLYGNDIDEQTTPVEAGLDWALQKVRRSHGARAGGFPGAGVVLSQLDNGPSRVRVGLQPDLPNPIRSGAALFPDPDSTSPIGSVTSGGFGPSVGRPIAMGYIERTYATEGQLLFADVRGKRLPLRVTPLPFVKTNYKRRH